MRRGTEGMSSIKSAIRRAANRLPACLAVCLALAALGWSTEPEGYAPVREAAPLHYDTSLFGRSYRLDDERSLAKYVEALGRETERAKREEKEGEAFEKDPLHHKLPKNYIEKSLRKAFEETRECAMETAKAAGVDRQRLLKDLWVMAGALRATWLRVLPPNMTAFEAMARQREILHPPVGLGRNGVAVDLASPADPDNSDPMLPSSYWSKPGDIARRDLYYGFGRAALPDLDDVLCTYDRSKQSRGVHGGYEVKCGKHEKVKLKFGEQYSQPFAQRIFWTLGFNTPPADCARTVKVKWDPRIFTEYNTRQDETVTVSLFGFIPIARSHLQRDLDPLDPVAEIVMLGEDGKETTIRPNPTWDAFKRKLYRDPSGKPYMRPDNFNEPFAKRIQYLVYHNVNVRMKPDEDDGGTYLGNWDLNGEGNGALRENRGYAFACAWISQFDTPADNNKLYMIRKDGRRLFKHCFVDLGGCLGPARDSRKMYEQAPSDFPWSFTRPAKKGETAIPLDGSYHTTLKCAPFVDADIHDARWMCRYIAQLTGDQILQALVATRMPSAEVRLYFDKLVKRRNNAVADLGLAAPPLKPMDESETFDYDPAKDGPISIVTSRGERVTAPDDNMVVLKGRLYTREQVASGFVARDSDKATRSHR
jgi:hypothetical protein